MEKILNNDHITKIDEFHTSFVKNYKLSSICQVCHVKSIKNTEGKLLNDEDRTKKC